MFLKESFILFLMLSFVFVSLPLKEFHLRTLERAMQNTSAVSSSAFHHDYSDITVTRNMESRRYANGKESCTAPIKVQILTFFCQNTNN